MNLMRFEARTGTPPGVGVWMTPPVFLHPAEVVKLGTTGLGAQSQTVTPMAEVGL
ncbi:MAG: hypothetical protein ACOH2H_06985 [Cypionkella sp.]